MADSVHIRGENGLILKMDLPLPEHINDRLIKGYLKRVNEDGSDYVPPIRETEGSDLTNGIPPRPATSAPKAEWVGHVVRAMGISPDVAEGMTKQDLIDFSTKYEGSVTE